MAEADLGDIATLAKQDQDVGQLLALLKKVLTKYGAFLTMRMVAFILAPYKRKRFESQLEVKEYCGDKFLEDPASLVGKEPAIHTPRGRDRGMDHAILWQRQGKLISLTSEPYYVKKEQMKALVVYCDEYGIDFQIDAESCYYPGHTIRILFKKDFVSKYDVMQQMAGEKR